jgi:hypothetical protein
MPSIYVHEYTVQAVIPSGHVVLSSGVSSHVFTAKGDEVFATAEEARAHGKAVLRKGLAEITARYERVCSDAA